MEHDRSSLSGPRHTPPDTPLSDVRVSPPAPGAPSGPDETHRSNLRSLLRRSAPGSTGSPSAPPGRAPSECPAASASHSPSVCRRAVPVAAGRSWRAALPGFLQKAADARFPRFDLFDRHAVHPRCALVGSHPPPRRFQHVAPIDPVVQHVKPELRFLLGLLIQLLSQQREFLRHSDGAFAAPVSGSSVVGCPKRFSFPLTSACFQ